jgi:arylsulfatase A-like enzyme
LNALAQSAVADNTIVVFTSDHGECGGAHGMHGKAFAFYEESIRVPLYVKGPAGTFVPGSQVGTARDGLTSHVDLVPLLMTLASGENEWRNKPAYAHLAERADLAVAEHRVGLWPYRFKAPPTGSTGCRNTMAQSRSSGLLAGRRL